MENINNSKSWFFENITKIGIPLPSWSRTKEQIMFTYIRNEIKEIFMYLE